VSGRGWHHGLPPVTVSLPCGPATHRLTWRRGRLVLHDHPGLAAERALLALGADRPTCLDVVDAWASLARDPCRLAWFGWLVQRWPNEVHPMDRPPALAARPPGRPSSYVPGQHAPLDRLPVDLLARSFVGVVAACDRRWDALDVLSHEELTGLIGAAAGRAAARCMGSWQRLARVRAPAVQCHLVPPGHPPSFTGRIDHATARAEVGLPLAWFWRVWASQPAEVDGCFVLDRRAGTAEAVRWEREGAAARPVVAPARLWRDADGRPHLRWL